VLTRCRHVNESFKPLPEDHELALAAAEQCHNKELTRSLRA
jgi:hypothetical protein